MNNNIKKYKYQMENKQSKPYKWQGPRPQQPKMECPICYEEVRLMMALKCGHKFCTNCIRKLRACAMCRGSIERKPNPEAEKRMIRNNHRRL